MKFNRLSILAVAIISVGCLAFSGCQTSNNTQAQAVEQTLITLTAADATTLVIQKNPQYAPDFAAADVVLTALETGTNQISPQIVDAALASAGQTNAVANMVALNGVTALNAWASTLGTNQVSSSQMIRTGLGWVTAGISQGLAALGR